MSFLLDVLDYVPIVGTVKNTVEAIVASASGDEEKAKEKLTSALVGGVLDAVTLGSGSIVAKSAGKMGGKALARTGTRVLVKRSITKVAAKTTAQQVAVNVSGRAVSKLMLGNTNGPNNEEERPPSKKGEHVINNNVLNVYRDIVRSFVNDVMHDNLDGMINSGRLSANSTVVKLINQPVSEDIARLIRTVMVVHFKETHIEKNAATYGRNIKKLREVIISYMESIYNAHLNQNWDYVPKMERNVRDSVEGFIGGDYFVDPDALAKWLKNGGNKQEFKEAHQEVVKMFRKLKYDKGNDMVIKWVKELFDSRK